MRLKQIWLSFAALICLSSSLGAQDPGAGGPTSKSVLRGASATLWADFQDGTGLIDHGVGTVSSGSPVVVTPLTSTVYTLTITNLAGDFVTQQITVNVAPVVVSAISPNSRTITSGHTATFTATVSGAVVTSLVWSVDGIPGGSAGVGTITSGGVYTAPASGGTHTITGTSTSDPSVSQSASVTVVPPPSIDVALAATPGGIFFGGSSTLTASYSNGTAVLSGGSTNEVLSASPVNFTTPSLNATTVYTLTVTNAAGDSATGQVTVTVSAVTMTALAPASRYLSVTKAFQPSGGVVNGAMDASVIWSVNGVVGGDGTVGTVDAVGNYQAPAVLPATPAVVIRCTSVAEPGVYQEMAVNLVKLPTIQSFTVN